MWAGPRDSGRTKCLPRVRGSLPLSEERQAGWRWATVACDCFVGCCPELIAKLKSTGMEHGESRLRVSGIDWTMRASCTHPAVVHGSMATRHSPSTAHFPSPDLCALGLWAPGSASRLTAQQDWERSRGMAALQECCMCAILHHACCVVFSE